MKLHFQLVVLCAVTITTILATPCSVNVAFGKKNLSFNKDVAPIFYQKCIECHRPGDIAPMSLITYDEARPWARSIKEKVIAREMPPWSPHPSYGEFKNDRRLSQSEIDTIVAWVDEGAREGDSKDLPKPPALAGGGWQLGEPEAILTPKEQFIVQPRTPDIIQNFIVPTDFKEDRWVNAAEILPSNKRIVHHAIAFVQTPDVTKGLRQGPRRATADKAKDVFYIEGTLLKVKNEAPVIDDGCGLAQGGSAFEQPGAGERGEAGSFLAGYSPGKGPDLAPLGTAVKIPVGSLIALQIHYSTFNWDYNEHVVDRPRLGLYFAKSPQKKEIHTLGVQNHFFRIPARASNHRVTACYKFNADVRLAGYMPHMHLRGKDMKYEAIYPDGRRETLLWVPKFSFNWQTMYYLKEPVLLPKGSTVVITAHYNNSAKNKYNPDPTKDIRWGDSTSEEMLIGWLNYYTDAPHKPGTQ